MPPILQRFQVMADYWSNFSDDFRRVYVGGRARVTMEWTANVANLPESRWTATKQCCHQGNGNKCVVHLFPFAWWQRCFDIIRFNTRTHTESFDRLRLMQVGLHCSWSVSA